MRNDRWRVPKPPPHRRAKGTAIHLDAGRGVAASTNCAERDRLVVALVFAVNQGERNGADSPEPTCSQLRDLLVEHCRQHGC